MTETTLRSALAIGLALGLAACGVADDGASGSTTTSSALSTTAVSTTSTASQTTSVSKAVPSDILDKIVDRAAADLAVSAERISIERSSRVVWRDSSLGCPEPGRVYMQVLTDGYWVILDSPEGQLDYRASLDGRIVTCEEGQEPLTDTDRS